MSPLKAALKVLRSVPSLVLLTVRTLTSDMADRLAKRKRKKRGERWLKKSGNIKRREAQNMDEKPKPEAPEELKSPFPPEPEKEKSPSPSPSPKTTGDLLSEAAAAARAELEDLSGDAADGFHGLVQLVVPEMEDMPEKKHKRIATALARDLERQGIKAVPFGFSLGIALVSGYAPLIKDVKAKRAAQKKTKGKPDDRDRGKTEDGKNDAAKVADITVKS